MKNMIAFLLMIISLFSIKYILPQEQCMKDYEKITIVSDKRYELFEENLVQNGNDYYYTFDNDENVMLSGFDYKALVIYYKEFDIKNFKSQCDVFYQCEDVGGYKIYEGYMKGVEKYVMVNNKKVNFQLAIRESDIVLGLPMIVTGF